MRRCDDKMWWQTSTIRRTLRSHALGKNFDWTPVPGHLACNLFLGALLRNSCLVTSLGNLFLETCDNGTCSWEPCFGELFGTLGNLLRNLAWGPCLETWLGNLAWKPALGTCSWEPLWTLQEPCLGTFPGNLTWSYLLTWRSAIWLLWPAPGPLLWLKTPSFRCWGKNT